MADLLFEVTCPECDATVQLDDLAVVEQLIGRLAMVREEMMEEME